MTRKIWPRRRTTCPNTSVLKTCASAQSTRRHVNRLVRYNNIHTGDSLSFLFIFTGNLPQLILKKKRKNRYRQDCNPLPHQKKKPQVESFMLNVHLLMHAFIDLQNPVTDSSRCTVGMLSNEISLGKLFFASQFCLANNFILAK